MTALEHAYEMGSMRNMVYMTFLRVWDDWRFFVIEGFLLFSGVAQEI